jgi:hypothetical protein
MKKPETKTLFSINILLLVSSVATAFSGLTIMIHYHMGHQGDISTTYIFWGIDYVGWSAIHKTGTIVLSLIMAYHILLHWKWYKNVLLKKLLTKNRQVILLTVIFIVTALTGFFPWLLQSGDVSDTTRRGILEIHDKMGIVLIVFLVLHVSKRFNWFTNTYAKLKGNHE